MDQFYFIIAHDVLPCVRHRADEDHILHTAHAHMLLERSPLFGRHFDEKPRGRLTEKPYDLYCIWDQGRTCWLYVMYIQVHTQHAGQRHLSSSNGQPTLGKIVTGTHQPLAYSFTQRPHRGGSTCNT